MADQISKQLADVAGEIADAFTHLKAVLLSIPPMPGPEPEPPIDPDPEPEPSGRSIWGWNANHCLYYSNGRPWNNKALLTSIHSRPGSSFSKFGELISGEGLLPIWLSSAMAEPGTYVVSMPGSGSANPSRFELRDSLDLQRFDINLRGDCRGLTVRREGDTSMQRLTPEAIARHRNAGAIRLMDMRHTNAGDQRAGNHYRINSEGNPPIVEQTITPYQAAAMAQETGKTPIWWNWHHLDSLGFMREVCEEFKAIGGEWPIYFEVSNEIWNGTFPVGDWADQVMGTGPHDGRYTWLNKRTRDMSVIVKQILGDRAIIVIGGQCTSSGVAQKVLAGGVEGIDALAIAPYLNWFQIPPTSFAEALVKIKSHTAMEVIPGILANRGIARNHGLRLVAYEAGVDISWHNQEHMQTLYERLNESDEVADLYVEFMDWWAQEINDLCLFYCDTNHHGYGHFKGERLPPLPKGLVVQESIGVV